MGSILIQGVALNALNNDLFGTKHKILIAVSLLLIVGLYILSRKIKLDMVCRILFYVGIASEIVKIFYYIVANEEKYGGVLPKTDLPFHLCSIQIIFIAIVNIAKSERLKRFIFSFMLPSCFFGGIAAILIATSSARSTWIITIQYFLYHIAISVFALRLFTDKELSFNIKDYFNCLKFLLGIMFFAIYINSILYDGVSNINFMYVVKPPQDGLPYLNDDNGWLSYIIKYAILVVGLVTLTYIKPIIDAIRERVAKAKSTEKSE